MKQTPFSCLKENTVKIFNWASNKGDTKYIYDQVPDTETRMNYDVQSTGL